MGTWCFAVNKTGVFCGLLLFRLLCGLPLNAAENWIDVILEEGSRNNLKDRDFGTGVYRKLDLEQAGIAEEQDAGKNPIFNKPPLQNYDPLSCSDTHLGRDSFRGEETKEFVPTHLFLESGAFSGHYSQTDSDGVYFEDKLMEILKNRDGIFIEAGANDGLYQSTTKMLEEKLNWTGILIEPSPKAYQRLCINRPSAFHFQCALGSFAQNNTTVFGNFDGDLQSKVGGMRGGFSQIEVPVRTLQSILDEVNITHIDFFSLDTEGYELNVLKGIDFSKTTFGYLLVEVGIEDYDSITTLLDENGYELVCNFSGYCVGKNPGWTGDHNDYLFKHKRLKSAS